MTLFWPARTGSSYRAEYAESLPAVWRTLELPVSIVGGQAAATDTTASGTATRFYRVVETNL